ncbi:MAG TPA: hypothetical protein VM370_01540 [Candidatus Thermoplasmatota archaeon]|nr:hypothetical protein [Candidatus Thermoplasmatota archaeon]
MGLREGRDGGSTAVLEAIVMTTIMLGSIAFVVTFDAPANTTSSSRAALEQRVRDVLAILNDTPVAGSSLGTNELSVALLQCLQNDCGQLASDLDDLMPEGSRYALYLSTGSGLYPIYAPREPQGEAVTARRLIEPAWSYQFMSTSQTIYNPLEDPMVVHALPVYSANPIHQGGSQLTIVARGNHTADHAGYILKTSGATRAMGPTDAPGAAAISVYFHAGDGVPLASRDVRAQTLTGVVPSNAPVPFSVRVEESGGGTLPEGATVTVAIPHGWTASAGAAPNSADWTILSAATDVNGSASSNVVARLKHAVTSGHADLGFDATYMGDADDYYTFNAYLSSGAFAHAALLVRGDAHATRPDFEVPTLIASIPRPLGAAAVTTWTLSAFSSDPLDITRIEIAEDEGRAIFTDATGITGGGTWSAQGDRLVWTGAASIDHNKPLNLTFHVTSTSLHGPAIERAPFVPSADFGNFTGALATETAPGFHRGVFLPATSAMGGYDPSVTGVSTTHLVESGSVYRTTDLPGSARYQVGVALGLKDSVFGSAVTGDHRYVEPGDTIGLSVDVQSVIYQLAQLGVEPSVNLSVYPPWAGDDRTPIFNNELYNGSVAKGAGTFLRVVDTNGDGTPDATDIGRLSQNLTIPGSWLFGPYVVEVNINWLEDVVLSGVTQHLVRTARVYDYFVVRPMDGDLPSSPVYDVHLVGWYEDWG